MFNVGDLVKLNDYSHWGDYQSHKGQKAIVSDQKFPPEQLRDKSLTLIIQWKDGKFSAVNHDNLIMVEKAFTENEKKRIDNMFKDETGFKPLKK